MSHEARFTNLLARFKTLPLQEINDTGIDVFSRKKNRRRLLANLDSRL